MMGGGLRGQSGCRALEGAARADPRTAASLLGKFKDAEPFNGEHSETRGVTTEMPEDFAERRGLNLIVLHGNTKIRHVTGGSEQWLCFAQWDNHAYFVKNSRPYVQKPVSDLNRHYDIQRVDTDRDVKIKMNGGGGTVP